ncbi:MAG: DUF885 domain-containing protein [Lachnospiraceae bacterium]
MKSKHFRFMLRCCVLLFTFMILSSGCTNSNTQNTKTLNQDFTSFTNQLFIQEVSSNSISLHYTLQNPSAYGIKNPPITFGSYNANTTLALAGLENCHAALQSFSYPSLSSKNQITYEILDDYLTTAINGAPYLLYDEPLSPITGIQAQLPVLLSEYQFHTTKDVDTYLSLLSDTPKYFDSLILFEQKKADSGLFISDFTLNEIIKQCNAFISLKTNNYLLSTFEERVHSLDNITPAQQSVYTNLNQNLIETSVIPAYQNLIDFLSSMLGIGKNENGLYYLPKGSDYYSYLVKRETGSSRSIDQLQALSYAQIERDLQSIERILSTKEGKNITASDTASYLTKTDPTAILTELQKNLSANFPSLYDVDIHIKHVPKDMEPYLSPAFYMIPAIDHTSANVIYINQSQMGDSLELYTTLAHEGYPGHLYQNTYFASKNPTPIRSILNYGGYLEGWATYAEMCSYYLSPLPKNHATLLQKNASVMLGLYALADIGIHSNGWTLLETTKFFNNYGVTDSNTIKKIFEYIVGDPSNYLKYYIGYLEFLELKKVAIKRWGNDFSQKRFHETVLDIGPAPFDVIREQISPN